MNSSLGNVFNGEKINGVRIYGNLGEQLWDEMPEGFLSQIENFLEIYWVALPYDDNKDNYHKKHQELQKLLGAVKNTRQFSQTKEPAGRKCSLDGERNALFYRHSEAGSIPHIQTDAQPIQTHNDLLTPGEALSAISLGKRFYENKEDKQEFPSTAEIALMKVINEDILKGKHYKKYFEGRFDYQFCYEENLTKEALIKSGINILLKYTLFDVQKACKALTENIRTKYYAILVFDGDNMGKMWSGEGLSLTVTSQLQMFQQRLAIRLGIYATYATAYINGNIQAIEDETCKTYIDLVRECKDHNSGGAYKSRITSLDIQKGKTVYAGGDDFLGFVNLNYLFEVMKELRKAYTALVEVPIKQEFQSFSGTLTFTAGVAIAHYTEPLSVVLGEARAAERAAKNAFENDDKNAFSMAV